MDVESRAVNLVKGMVPRMVVRDGGQEWLHQLFETNRDLVFRYALSRLDREAAKEIVAETFTEAASSRTKFDPQRGTEASWLLGIATNRIRRWHRTESRYVGLNETSTASLGAEDSNLLRLPGRVDDERRSTEVRQAVEALPEGERAAFLLHAVEGLTNAEVAEVLGISSVAAKLRVFRARRRLQQTLGKHINEMDAK